MPDVQTTALPLSFCLEGFRLIRQRPTLIAFWGAVTLFGNTVAALLAVAVSGPVLQHIAIEMQNPTPDLQAIATLVPQALPGAMAFLLVEVVVSAVITAAVCRAVLAEADGRLGYLRFGPVELRFIMISLTMLALSMLVPFVVAVISGVAAGDAETRTALVTLGLTIGMGLVIWLRFRLSFNYPQTFESGRLDLFGGFKLTQPVFWPLAAGYVVTALLFLAVSFLLEQEVRTILTLVFGRVAEADLTSLRAFLSAQNVVYLLLTYGIASPLISAIVAAAPVAAYASLKRSALAVSVR